MWRSCLILLVSASALASAASDVPSGHTVFVELMIERSDGALVTCEVPRMMEGLGSDCGSIVVGPSSATGPWTVTGVVAMLDGIPATQVVAPGPEGPAVGYVLTPEPGEPVRVPLTGELASSPWPGPEA